jgi:hypothetical protein
MQDYEIWLTSVNIEDWGSMSAYFIAVSLFLFSKSRIRSLFPIPEFSSKRTFYDIIGQYFENNKQIPVAPSSTMNRNSNPKVLNEWFSSKNSSAKASSFRKAFATA